MTTIPLHRVIAALDAAGILVSQSGGLPATISDIADDSRAVTVGALFVAVRGSERDGHDFLAQASARGAAAVIVENEAATPTPAIIVSDGRLASAIAAAVAFREPARELALIAVTGTNGKTTTTGILRHLLHEPEAPSASMGTLGVLVGSAGDEIPGGEGLTTPGPVELQRILRVLVDRGVRRVSLEVSSHSLDQRRIAALAFDVAVFTNLSRDHLDYHGTLDAYLAAKARLVGLLAPGGTAVINADDPAWATLPSAPRTIRYGVRESAHVRASDLLFTRRGSEWTLRVGGEALRVRIPLIGEFNVANALAAAAAAHAFGMPASRIAERLAEVPQVPGRLELLHEQPTVLRDYAHTPDALERALAALRPFVGGRLIVVFGCGGDRDRGKRPAMGAIAECMADHVVITSDNPRTEDPERIIDDILAGMRGTNNERIEDRRLAIARALDRADPDEDLVLLAGKGHETYQIRGTVKLPFDERAIVRELTGWREGATA